LLPALVAAALVTGWPARAQTVPVAPDAAASAAAVTDPLKLKGSRMLAPGKRSSARAALVVSGDHISSQVDQRADIEGHAELRHGEVVLRADKLDYLVPEDLAHATGEVQVSHGGNLFSGPELSLYINRFEGEFLKPSFYLARTGGSGKAESVQFLDSSHIRAKQSTYSSCPVEPGQEPAWQISARRIDMDLDGNEAVAEGAVLRFLGVPILAAPSLSFPLASERKSGWLPPNVFLDNRSGLEVGVPYYWNIAPQRDLTVTPFIMSRRGPGLDSEFRYLEPGHAGQVNLNLLPNDRVAGRSRWSMLLRNEGELGRDWKYRLRSERVSDDDYWKDISRRLETQTPRLLASDLQLGRSREIAWANIETYARVQRWQVLQGADVTSRFESPYQRAPQVGVRLTTAADEAVLDSYRPWGRQAHLEGGAELEYNRFHLPPEALASQTQTGQRVHFLAHIGAPTGGEAWWLIPKLSVNAASYDLDQIDADGRRIRSRVIPSLSVDHGWVFERETTLFGRSYLQSLEPRLLYVNTLYRTQANLPNFDSAAKDFNFDSIYTDNQFTGVDRVSDLHALSFGATSRWVNPVQGEEVLRLGAVQRVLFRDQRVTPDGVPITQRFSDLLLAASAHVSERWWGDASVEINPETSRSVRSVLRARYSPGPYRTVSVAYRFVASQSEQVELAWQWPLTGTPNGPRASGSSGGSCAGAWYSAARVQYSLRDRRLTDSVGGVEYDAGCWVFRVGLERLSTGRAETNTRLMLQLELVGLSQLGSNALKVLKDNIPGYRRLSSDSSPSSDFLP
jgi:LPS-assembly protein